MNARKLVGLFALILFGSGFGAAPVYASGLLGASLGWQYYGGGIAYNPGNGSQTSGTFTDNGGIGGTFIDQGDLSIFNIVADSTSITFDYSVNISAGPAWSDSPESLAPTIYNGIAIDLLSDGSVTGVTIDAATNMAGFGASDLSFSSNQIEVNWADLAYSTSTIVKLDVTLQGSTPSPEPSTGVLTVVSLLSVFFAGRRKLIV
jgi:hypothetical protein